MTHFHSQHFLESEEFLFYAEPYHFKENETIEPHSHDFFELVYVAQGEGEHLYKGDYFHIHEGDVFMIEPGEEHAYRTGKNHPPLVYNVLFQTELLRRELESLADVTSFVDFFYVEPFLRNTVRFQAHLHLHPTERLEMESLIDRTLLEFKEKKLGYRILIKTRLIELFIFLSRCYQERKQSPLRTISSDEKVIRHVSEFLRKHYAQSLTLRQVSEMCGMSQAAFSSKFKQYIGKTFIEYRNEVRIRIAQERLVQSDDKVLNIAQQVGYDDLSHFNKLFKAATGMSPSQYRRSATLM